MGSIHSYANAKGEQLYRVAYRDSAHVQHTKRGFRTKKAARVFLSENEAAIATGTYIDPRNAKTTVENIYGTWFAGKSGTWSKSWTHSIDASWRTHVASKWGQRRVGEIRHSEIQVWVSSLAEKRSPTVVLRAFGILKGIFELAVNDNLIREDPSDNIELPKKVKRERPILTAEQVLRLADAAGDDRRALILVLAFEGLRWAEATGLLVKDIDFDTMRIEVGRTATKVGSEIIVEERTKNYKSRQVPMFDIVAEALRTHVKGKSPNDLVFTDPDGHYCRQQSIAKHHTSWYSTALKKADVPLVRVHDLRHTAASLLIAQTASPLGVQRMLGHSSATMTLDVYANLTSAETERVTSNFNAYLKSVR